MRADFPQKIGDRKLNRFPSPSENIDLGLFISRSEGFYKIKTKTFINWNNWNSSSLDIKVQCCGVNLIEKWDLKVLVLKNIDNNFLKVLVLKNIEH